MACVHQPLFREKNEPNAARFGGNQHKAPPARVLQLPETAQSTRPPDNAGLSTKVSPFNPELV